MFSFVFPFVYIYIYVRVCVCVVCVVGVGQGVYVLIAHVYLVDKNEDELIGTLLSPCVLLCVCVKRISL